MKKLCSVTGCVRDAKKKGMCSRHYNMQLLYGRTHNIVAEYGSGRLLTKGGYVLLTVNGQRKYEHIHVAEKALGKPLPQGAVVHHADENKADNAGVNLVICPNQSYHRLLHDRLKLLGIKNGKYVDA